MVQNSLIASRSFQPDSKSRVIFAATANTSADHASPTHTTTPTQTTMPAGQDRIEISEFLNITED
jgi:hypothetical protein